MRKIRASLASIGADREAIERLVLSPSLNRITIPMYSRAGLSADAHSFCLTKLPGFLRKFGEEFPNGVLRWDQNYQAEGVSEGHIAIRVYFNYQEDDQGTRWSYRPTPTEEERYHRMLSDCTYKGKRRITAHEIIFRELRR